MIPATADATPIGVLIQNVIDNALTPEAVNATHDAKTAFDTAVLTAKQIGQAPPVSYVQTSVDADLVRRLMTGQDTTFSDWNNVLIHTTITPPTVPPTPVVIQAGYPVGQQITLVNPLFYALDGSFFPDGSTFADARGKFLKHVVSNGIGVSSYWEKVG